LHSRDLQNVELKKAGAKDTGEWFSTLSQDPYAFFLVLEGQELTWDTCCPEGAEVLLEPATDPTPGDLVIVRTATGLALRRFVLEDGQPELRSLTAAQRHLEWSEDLELARVARIMVDPRRFTK